MRLPAIKDRGCVVPGCEGKHEGLGYCRTHYRRFKKHGTPYLTPYTRPECTVGGCARDAKARGLCEMHYTRWAHTGTTDPHAGRSLAVRLQERLVPEGDCLVWTGHRHKGQWHGQIGDGKTLLWTHRVAWELAFGPIPDGKKVLHRCDNPPCCKPEHLFLGDQADNVADMIAKGRAYWQRNETAS